MLIIERTLGMLGKEDREGRVKAPMVQRVSGRVLCVVFFPKVWVLRGTGGCQLVAFAVSTEKGSRQDRSTCASHVVYDRGVRYVLRVPSSV